MIFNFRPMMHVKIIEKQIVLPCNGGLYGCYLQKEKVSIPNVLLDA